MRKFSKIFNIQLFALLFIVMFAACKKDENVKPQIGEGDFSLNNGGQQIVSRNNDEGLCFEVEFPVTVALPDGSEVVANSMDELDDIYNNWFEQHPTDSTCPAIVYPINVTLEDGSTHTVDSEAALIELISDCIDIDLGWEECFVIQYPLSINYPDGTTVSYDNEGDMYNDMVAWSEAHPNDTLYPTFDYPITVVKADGSVVSIEDDVALNALFEDCFGTVDPGDPVIECFEYVFPMTVALPDGTTQVANSYEELDAIFIDWFENHPNDTTGFPTIAYPLNLQLESGEIVTVNNDEELFAIFDDCFGSGGGGSDPGTGIEDCFTFNYPLSLLLPDGAQVPVYNDEELMNTVFAWYEQHPDDSSNISFVYPISVTLTADGSVVTVNSDEELDAILTACYDCPIVGGTGENIVLGDKQSAAVKMAMKTHAKVQKKSQQRISHMLTGAKSKQAARF